MHAIVIGAGIGGLATSLALSRRGWTVELIERQPAITPAGAGLLLWPNAIHALRSLGAGDGQSGFCGGLARQSGTVGDAVVAAGTTMTAGGSRTPSGRWLGGFDARRIADRLGAPLVAAHRADVHETLLDALPSSVTIHTGRTVDDVAALDADLIVGADGIGSVVRAHFAPEATLRDSGQVAWRAVVPLPGFDATQRFGETLGRGWRFGAAPLGRRGVYWYVAAPGPLRTTAPAAQLDELRTTLASWHDPIPALLAATRPDQLLHHALLDLHPVPPMRFGDRVALVGDAAHAMTPNLGQGACLALEDAVVLAAALDQGVAAGLAHYDAVRRPRASMVVARSWQAGRVSGAPGWLAGRVRDLLLSAMPDRLTERSAAAVANWRPPAEAARVS